MYKLLLCIKKTGFFSLLLFTCIIATAQVQITNLKVENLINPLGIDRQQPAGFKIVQHFY